MAFISFRGAVAASFIALWGCKEELPPAPPPPAPVVASPATPAPAVPAPEPVPAGSAAPAAPVQFGFAKAVAWFESDSGSYDPPEEVEVLDATTDPEFAKCTPDTWANFGKAFFKLNCSRCHGRDFSTRARLQEKWPRWAIAQGYMPRYAALTESDKARILKWFDCGAK